MRSQIEVYQTQRKRSEFKLRQPVYFIFLKGLLTLIFMVAAFQYFQIKLYDFPAQDPFKGNHIYNPYNKRGNWLKANFHAHSTTWGGLTNGHQDGSEVVRQYNNFHYDIACVSDYHSLNNGIYNGRNLAIPVYEHGINFGKSHQLAIGSDKVTHFDVMFWQNTSIKQYLINKLREDAQVVCINHPSIRNGHPVSAFPLLTGYNCLEVLNRDRMAFEQWDAALSAGRPVWILANDDCHDINKNGFARAWTLVKAETANRESVIKALTYGNTIGVYRNKMISNRDSLQQWVKGNSGELIEEVTTEGMKVHYHLKKPAKKITLIGQGGLVKSQAVDTNQISYSFNANDTYIRAEIETSEVTIYLNPVLRYPGNFMPVNTMEANVRLLPTLLLRLCIVFGVISYFFLLYPQTCRWLLYGTDLKMQMNK